MSDDKKHFQLPNRMKTGVIRNTVDSLGSNGGYRLSANLDEIEKIISGVVVDRVHTKWNEGKFKETSIPIVISKITDKEKFSSGGDMHVSDMPIKLAGSNEVLVPSELVFLREALQKCINAELSINPHFKEYNFYITLQRAMNKDGEMMRGSGPHSDSIQGPRINPKTPIEHGFLVSDFSPPIFYTHGFDLGGLISDHDYLNSAFIDQCDRSGSFTPDNYELVLFDAYCIHEAKPVPYSRTRTFFRLTASLREFDRLGNTKNKLLDYDWKMACRPVPYET